MRFLPRTKQGTWLLAGTAWLAWCAAVWWALPAQPRAVTVVPGENRLIGFGPGGRSVLFEGVAIDLTGDWPPTVPVRLWDTADGSVRTILPAKDPLATYALSPDGRWFAVGERQGDGHKLRVI